MTNLYLASTSQTRRHLLSEAGYAFEILHNTCTTEPFNQSLSIRQNVEAAAICKAVHINLPDKTPSVSQTIYVIAADTLIADVKGEILQKPRNLEHAKEQLTQLSAGKCTIATACIIQKFKWSPQKGWVKKSSKILHTKGTAEFWVPKESFGEYFSRLPIALHVCGAGVIEGFGSQFLKKFNGSYSAALGLPLFEIKKTLQDLGWART